MNLIADVTLLQAITLFSFGFLGALIGGALSIFGGSKSKKAAQTAATNAAKQRAHELKMAQLAAEAAAVEAAAKAAANKKMMMLGGLGLVGVLIFLRKKR